MWLIHVPLSDLLSAFRSYRMTSANYQDQHYVIHRYTSRPVTCCYRQWSMPTNFLWTSLAYAYPFHLSKMTLISSWEQCLTLHDRAVLWRISFRFRYTCLEASKPQVLFPSHFILGLATQLDDAAFWKVRKTYSKCNKFGVDVCFKKPFLVVLFKGFWLTNFLLNFLIQFPCLLYRIIYINAVIFI